MWIVFGTGQKTKRVPGGAKVERRCGECDEVATFYEKEIIATFRLYFVDVFDYQRHRVMVCGCCGACYATDELGLPGTPARLERPSSALGEGVDRAAQRVSGTLGRAADAIEAGISSLFSDEPSPSPSREARDEDDGETEPSSDEDLDPLDDPLEARFRELERKAGIRSK